MTNYLLDTNHLSSLVTLSHPLRQRLLAQQNAGDSFAVPTPVLVEFLYGIGTLPRAKQNLEQWRLIADRFGYINVERRDGEEAGHLRLLLRRVGYQLSAIDALIAVLALRNDLTLLTSDRDFSFVPDIKVDNWR